MKAFFIGLQFLTRICVVHQTVWTEEDFGKSVRYFPLVGLVLGLCYAAVAWLLTSGADMLGWNFPIHLRAVLLAVLPFILTGGIHCDGFMDTVDGIFSGRERDRMLEIMKDSTCGSFAVTAFGTLLAVQYAAILDMPLDVLMPALLAMPIIGRLMMVAGITFFPYARNEGMGKAFGKYATRWAYAGVAFYAILLLGVIDAYALLALVAATIFTVWFGKYVTKKLGGLTGDVYGAICTLSELLVLITYLCIGTALAC